MRGSHHGEENAPGSTAYGYAGTPGGYPDRTSRGVTMSRHTRNRPPASPSAVTRTGPQQHGIVQF